MKTTSKNISISIRSYSLVLKNTKLESNFKERMISLLKRRGWKLHWILMTSPHAAKLLMRFLARLSEKIWNDLVNALDSWGDNKELKKLIAEPL